MLQNNITIGVRQLNPHVSVIDIQGELNSFAENNLIEAFNQANKNGVDTILFNFSKMDYINSSGIGLLITLLVRAKRQEKQFAAIGLNEHTQHIFKLTGLNQAFPFFPTEADALKA